MIHLFFQFISNKESTSVALSRHTYRKSQAGSVLSFIVLVFTAGIAVVAFSFDTTRIVDSLSQVKRATDAAAMAVGYKAEISGNTEGMSDLTSLAQNYISNNLGMDDLLRDQIDLSSVVVTTGKGSDGAVTYKVSVDVLADGALLDGNAGEKTIYSTVEVMSRPTEVAMMLPNTNSESSSDIAALKRLGKTFVKTFFDGADSEDANDSERWLSLIPYSQSVNVYDENDEDRIERWAAAGALKPRELFSLFRTGKVNSLADPRFPDRVANLLCMYRGLAEGENFFWDESPVSAFGIYYRHDLPENGSPGAAPISWVGPNPDDPDSTAVDTRWIVADKGCPNTPLLPLTNDQDEINSRLNKMTSRFNVNYAIALGWAAESLSPQMRGSDGWGDDELPLDFSENGDNYKAIIMLANTTGDWFDTDSYNFERDGSFGTGTDPSKIFAKQRFVDLCQSIHQRNIQVYLIGVRPGEPDDFGRVLFDKVAGPGMKICTNGLDNMHFVDGTGFAQGESQIENALEEIAKDIRRNHYVRLIN